MTKCVYCKNDYEIPRGLTLVMKDGKIHHLCSSKCRKNMLMKRRKVRWVLKTKSDKKVKLKAEDKKDKVEVKEIKEDKKESREKAEGKKVEEKKDSVENKK